MTQELFDKSIEVIKANQTVGGAYLASPNFEQYRYCWFRDGTYTAYAMDLVGEHESARRFYDWAASTIAGRADQVAQAVAAAHEGRIPAHNEILHTRYTVEGGVSDDEWPNFQLDGFGTLLWGMGRHLALTKRSLADVSGSWREAVGLLVRYLGALWRMPCHDCWEEFGDKIHTHTLACLYGGMRAAADMLGPGSTDAQLPAHTATLIKEYVLEECVVDGSLCKFKGTSMVDGSLVNVATPYGLLEPDDPVMVETLKRVEAELRRDCGGVHRYAKDTYYGGGEWVLLSAYLGWSYVERGDIEQAKELLAWVAGCATEGGELPEQVPEHLNYPEMLPVWEEQWGKIALPLLWSHASYITLVKQMEGAR